jgi:ubiquinone/menaquinone biosynthesis C-methylase UbiE
MTNSLAQEIFWAVHRDLPREAPGSDEATRQAFAMLPDLPPAPRILDIGCGPGAQTVVLAQESGGMVTAVDTHQPFLDDLTRRAAQAGVAERVQPLNASMFDLDFAEPFDLLWSEGAIYIIGLERGLREWRRLLKPGGFIAVTELCWLKPDPPTEATAFWQEGYPEMATIEENLARLTAAGYRALGHFVLPESAWWDQYYNPMAARIAMLRQQYQGNGAAQRSLDAEQAEIDLYRHCSAWYGYVFYVMTQDN